MVQIENRWFRHAHGNSDGSHVGLGRGGRRRGFSYGVTLSASLTI